MTSKEALKRLKQETAPATYMPDFNKKECCDVIERDLEVLEMLRPHLINAGIGMFDNVEDNEIFHLKLTFSGEEYKQIERWLENDKG